jgi:Fic family protein
VDEGGARDDGESVSRMEPMLPAEGAAGWRDLTDLAVDLVAKANRFAGQLHPIVRDQVGALVRSMNCYYSNLIEGHNTHPIDIDRALRHDLSGDPKRRNLQLEAKAHIEVQQWIDERQGGDISPMATAYLTGLHRAFYERLPDELRWAVDPETGEQKPVEPGHLRNLYIQVGRHVAVSPGAVPRFLTRLGEAYEPGRLTKTQRIVAVAASHHRLLWIHPFLDGNGRVARLAAHAGLLQLEVGSSLWSVARGLARTVTDYKRLLLAADEPRRGDLDGRGHLSESALVDFCAYFLRTTVDQVEFMERLLAPRALLGRIEAWVADEVRARRLDRRAFVLLREALLMGEIERGRVPALLGLGERQARDIAAQLSKADLLQAASHRAPLRLAFPIAAVERWFPALYPSLER